MREQVNSFQSHIESEVPFFFGKIDDVFADGNAGAVAEDVDLAPFLNRRFDGAAAIGCAAHIAVERQAPACPGLRISATVCFPSLSSISSTAIEAPISRQQQSDTTPDSRSQRP